MQWGMREGVKVKRYREDTEQGGVLGKFSNVRGKVPESPERGRGGYF